MSNSTTDKFYDIWSAAKSAIKDVQRSSWKPATEVKLQELTALTEELGGYDLEEPAPTPATGYKNHKTGEVFPTLFDIPEGVEAHSLSSGLPVFSRYYDKAWKAKTSLVPGQQIVDSDFSATVLDIRPYLRLQVNTVVNKHLGGYLDPGKTYLALLNSEYDGVDGQMLIWEIPGEQVNYPSLKGVAFSQVSLTNSNRRVSFRYLR
jgi:hypothetical protein